MAVAVRLDVEGDTPLRKGAGVKVDVGIVEADQKHPM